MMTPEEMEALRKKQAQVIEEQAQEIKRLKKVTRPPVPAPPHPCDLRPCSAVSACAVDVALGWRVPQS